MAEKKVGIITHYFDKIRVAVVKITERDLKVGDTIHIKGHTSDFTQRIESMQVGHKNVVEAKVGETVGMRVTDHAREHDEVFKVEGSQ